MSLMQERNPQPSVDPVKGGEIRDCIMESVLKNPNGVIIEEVYESVKADLPEVTESEIEEVIDFMLRNGNIEQKANLLKEKRVPIPRLPLY